jgi:hypothetical protein
VTAWCRLIPCCRGPTGTSEPVVGIPAALRGPAAFLKSSAEFLLESAGTVGQAVAKDAPALKGPAVDVLQQLAGGLRNSGTAMQTRVGRMDAPNGDVDVTAALATDPTITDAQRRVLLGIYSAAAVDGESTPAWTDREPDVAAEFPFDGP